MRIARFVRAALAAARGGEDKPLPYPFLLSASKGSQIRAMLSGRYAPVPLPAIAEYFELLAKAGAVSLR